MSMFEGLGFFTSPKTVPWIRDSGVAPKNMFRGPSSVFFIQPLVKYLCDEGVEFYFNTEITGVYDTTPSTPLIGAPGSIDINTLYKENDVLAICTPHMITAGFIPQHLPPHILHNEWSFGSQYYITDLDQLGDKLIPQRKDQAMFRNVIGAPWQIVYVIEYSIEGMAALKKRLGRNDLINFWNMDFGKVNDKPVLATITLTISNQYQIGLSTGKTFLNCTPEELLSESLIQIGIRKKETIAAILLNEPTFGSIQYIKAGEEYDKNLEKSWLKGPVQANGMRWVSDYTLYIKTANNPAIGCKGVCSLTNLRDNPACMDVNLLPDNVGLNRKNVSWHYMGLTTRENKEGSKPFVPASIPRVPDKIYLAGEYCESNISNSTYYGKSI